MMKDFHLYLIKKNHQRLLESSAVVNGFASFQYNNKSIMFDYM